MTPNAEGPAVPPVEMPSETKPTAPKVDQFGMAILPGSAAAKNGNETKDPAPKATKGKAAPKPKTVPQGKGPARKSPAKGKSAPKAKPKAAPKPKTAPAEKKERTPRKLGPIHSGIVPKHGTPEAPVVWVSVPREIAPKVFDRKAFGGTFSEFCREVWANRTATSAEVELPRPLVARGVTMPAKDAKAMLAWEQKGHSFSSLCYAAVVAKLGKKA
jgi:hypothetical protein